MTDTNTVWEQNFRQTVPFDAEQEVTNLESSISNTNGSISSLNSTVASLQSAVSGKANTNSPSFTGTPTTTTQIDPTQKTTQILNSIAHSNIHARGSFVSNNQVIGVAPNTWTTNTGTGSVTNNYGNVVLGAGSQGLSIPVGFWLVSYNGFLTGLTGYGYVEAGLDTNGTTGVAGTVICNSNPTLVNSFNLTYSNILVVGSQTQVRPAIFVNTGANTSFTYSSMSAVRLGQL